MFSIYIYIYYVLEKVYEVGVETLFDISHGVSEETCQKRVG
jgi:hypothetical protein